MQSGGDRLFQGPRVKTQPKVIIGIFTQDNAGVIEKIISPLSSISSDIVVCDDASKDSTAKIAQTLNAQVINHPQRLGSAAGIRSLFLAASQAKADVLVLIPTDAISDPASISKLVNSVVKQEADIVVGRRFAMKPVDLSENYDRSLLTVYGLPVEDPKSPFKAFSKAAIAAVVAQSLNMSDILPAAKKMGLGIMELQVNSRELFTKEESAKAISRRGPVAQLIEFTSIKHPIEFYGTASLVIFLAAIVKSYLTYETFKTSATLPDFDVIIIVTLFLIWVMMSITTVVLYSLSRNITK
jgi:glycosyltransferase involved in cell wall biosynthesis